MQSRRAQHVQEGHRGGGQPEVFPLDQGEVPLHLQVRDWERPQDAVLHLAQCPTLQALEVEQGTPGLLG